MIRYWLQLLIYRWKDWKWRHFIGYPRCADLFDRGWGVDHESRRLIYAKWDADWAAKQPQRPVKPALLRRLRQSAE